MPECIWCYSNGSGYWECDGEGGACDPRHEGQDPPPDCLPGAAHWKIQAVRPLNYRNGDAVKDSQGHAVSVTIDATAAPYKVRLNGTEVHGNENCGSVGRRPWAINKIVSPIVDEHGNVVVDPDGKPTRVRVQSYVYPSPKTPDHCDGEGPKVRFYAINPDDPDCDPAVT